MNNLTLRQLRYAEALAEQGHFGLAAGVCAISQPALSMQIRELEAALGLPVFERGGRQVRLTPFGQDFIARARAILAMVDDLGDLARAAKGGALGRLRLGVIPTVAPYLLPRLMARLSKDQPNAELNPRETITPRLISELTAGRLDAAIVALPVSESAFFEMPLFEEDFILVRPLAEAARPVPDAAGLRAMRLLLLEEGHCFRDQALSFCASNASGPPREVLEGSSLSTLVQMVAGGIGVTLIPQMAVGVETRAAAVSLARFRPPVPARRIGMIWRRSSPLAAPLTALGELLRQEAAILDAELTAQGLLPVG